MMKLLIVIICEAVLIGYGLILGLVLILGIINAIIERKEKRDGRTRD